MSLPRFFLDEGEHAATGQTVTFPLGEMNMAHLNVLRIAPGESIALVFTDGQAVELLVEGVTSNGVSGCIVRELPRQDLPRVTLFEGIAKGERFDLAVRATTELGVEAIEPVITRRCIVRFDDKGKASDRANRWRKIALSSAEQSGRDAVPSVDDPMTLDYALRLLPAFDRVVVAWEELGQETDSLSMHDALVGCDASSKVAVFIGPEGGFEKSEVELLMEHGAKAITLGSTILRTETAAIVACALAMAELGGLGYR